MAEPPLFVEERKMRIIEFVEEHRKATVAELCEHFGMSSATIRNDLRDLENSNLVLRTHGGVMVKTKTGLELNSNQKVDQHLEAKKRIARAALAMIEDGDTIILDTGTSTLELARLLGERRGVTVVTNDLSIALVLEQQPETTTVFMGGIVRKNFHCTVSIGDAGAQIMPGLVVDKAFMGTNGLSLNRGATTPDISTAQTKKVMVTMASAVVVLCDSSKLGRDSFAQFAPFDQIDTIMTEACSKAEKDRLEEHGVAVVCCP
jgi:DeoR family transcriptional regulator, fructose operon transcriptional repressor